MSISAASLVLAPGVLASPCASGPPRSAILPRHDALGDETRYVAKRRVSADQNLLGNFDAVFLAPVRFAQAGTELTPNEQHALCRSFLASSRLRHGRKNSVVSRACLQSTNKEV